jgi:hypothetical protein
MEHREWQKVLADSGWRLADGKSGGLNGGLS